MPGGADKQLVPAWGEIMTLLVTNMTRTQFTDITDVNMNCLWNGHLITLSDNLWHFLGFFFVCFSPLIMRKRI